MTFTATRRRFGRYVFAIGGNPDAAELGGINVHWTITKTYVVMGMLVAVAAAVQTARLNAAVTNLGVQNELDVISAAVIGGSSLSGGIGTIPGALLGAVVMQSADRGDRHVEDADASSSRSSARRWGKSPCSMASCTTTWGHSRPLSVVDRREQHPVSGRSRIGEDAREARPERRGDRRGASASLPPGRSRSSSCPPLGRALRAVEQSPSPRRGRCRRAPRVAPHGARPIATGRAGDAWRSAA